MSDRPLDGEEWAAIARWLVKRDLEPPVRHPPVPPGTLPPLPPRRKRGRPAKGAAVQWASMADLVAEREGGE